MLAGRLGTEGLTPGSQLIINERESGNMLKADVKIPRWTRPLEELVANTTRTHPDDWSSAPRVSKAAPASS